MKIKSFSVTNYRSITNANRVQLGKETIILGKNNEGKSNILKALDLTMTMILRLSKLPRPRPIIRSEYDWEVDFPFQYRDKSKIQSIFRIKFSLSEEEISEFSDQIGSSINGELDIEIKIGKTNTPNITFPKKGKNTKAFKEKTRVITKFISDRIGFAYIPTIRTDDDVIKIIDTMINDVTSNLEEDQEYQEAMKVIDRLHTQKLDDVADNINMQLQSFLPNITDVRFEYTSNNMRQRFGSRYRSMDVIIDDGIATSIRNKGDGVKSIVAIAMLISSKSNHKDTVFAIEEPESHLHPDAIHQLSSIIHSLSQDDQVLVSTHNPLLVARDSIESNIIVDDGEAKPAKNIKEIRKVLGVRVSDNLINSRFVLVVEGKDDKISLSKILPALSEKIKNAMDNKTFTIQEIGGASNLSYRLSMLSNMFCVYHVLLDNDEQGVSSYEKAVKENLITTREVTITNCNGMHESEFEDCLAKDFYEEIIMKNHGVNTNHYSCSRSEKWSKRIESAFLSQGKPWNDNIKQQVKLEVANGIPKDANKALCDHKRNSIDALVVAIENMIK